MSGWLVWLLFSSPLSLSICSLHVFINIFFFNEIYPHSVYTAYSPQRPSPWWTWPMSLNTIPVSPFCFLQYLWFILPYWAQNCRWLFMPLILVSLNNFSSRELCEVKIYTSQYFCNSPKQLVFFFFWSVDNRHCLWSEIALDAEHHENSNSVFVDHDILILQHYNVSYT